MKTNSIDGIYEGKDGLAEPDWSSIIIEDTVAPWTEDGRKTITARYGDPMLRGYSAMIVRDTINRDYDPNEDLITPSRVTTMVVKFPRFILPEWNTHRVFSRNSASSRARSIKTTVRPVMEDPMVPLWTTNHKGMSGPFSSKAQALRSTKEWLKSRDEAVLGLFRQLMNNSEVPYGASADEWETFADRYDEAYKFDEIPDAWNNAHKQDCNRLIEPWMWHETLVTSTYWKNFIDLRTVDGVQPEMMATAILIREILHESPKREILRHETLHVPFIDVHEDDLESWSALRSALLQSASECARISYHDRSSMRNRYGSPLGEKLLEQKHMSPFEHIAWSSEPDDWRKIPALNEKMRALLADHNRESLTSNLSNDWIQFRRAVSDREQ